ncbi:hypothetical protein [Amycolatopsis sp. NPDC059657]|uniref:hypothetical protein n=1 Tax=Amycolatopsis sp. NPDC059657 TaxID=3346899 RepID=UPI00366C9968
MTLRPPPGGKAVLVRIGLAIVLVAYFGHAIADMAMPLATWIISIACVATIGTAILRRFWR